VTQGTKRPIDFLAKTKAWLQDKNVRVEDTKDLPSHITAAVLQYSKDRPYEVVEDVTGTATSDVPLPTTYIDGFSQIRSVEFPIGDVPATIIDENEWELYRSPTALKIRFLVDVPPAVAGNVRVTSTAAHTQGTTEALGAASTIPDADFDGVCALAASFAATQLVATYADEVEAATDAAFVQGDSRAQAYGKSAKELRELYNVTIGVGRTDAPSGKQAAGSKHAQAWVDLDSRGPAYGDTMTHPRRWT
jgi:hypothetical protein